jgi:hypothetical protein
MKQKTKETHKMHLLLGLIPLLWLMLNTDNGGGGNGGAGSQGENTPPAQPQGVGTGGRDEATILEGLQNLMRRQGGADATAQLLYHENARHRERIRELEQRVPGEGAVVLSGDQVQAWQTYSQLGAPTDLQQRLTAAEQAQQELAGLRRSEQIRGVAEAAGYKASVLERLAEGLTLELREEQREGQAARVPYVVSGEGQQQQATPLADYAQAHWADFLPALSAQQQQPAQGAGVTYPPQQGGGGQPKGNGVAELAQTYQKVRDERPNPLRQQ